MKKGIAARIGKWPVSDICIRGMAWIALSLMLQSCAAQYSAEAITGLVVDADTGKPLEGVIVTANWAVDEGNLAGTNSGGQLQILETVTDSTGHYHFPAWGPKSLPPKKNGWWVEQYIGSEDPGLLFFKSGYRFEARDNGVFSERNMSPIRRSAWNGKTIRMKFIGDNEKEYVEALSTARSMLSFALSANGCEWQEIPRMLAAVLNESEKYKQPGKFSLLLSILDIPMRERCGSPQEFLRKYLK